MGEYSDNPDLVIREDFDADEHLALMQSFYCGEEPYQLAVSDWIKVKDPNDSVLTDIQRWGTRVWVYFNQAEEIVGFGSLGTTEWSVPPFGRKKIRVAIIPNVAVAKKYWGLPVGNTYADQILDDLSAEAMGYADTCKALALAVHPDNQQAIKFYRRHKFVFIEPPMKDGHLRMATFIFGPPPPP